MNFKAYDILSSLVPGFLLLIVLLNFFEISYNNSHVVAYTAVAFLLGYLMNAISSWAEDIYYWSWGGKPSSKLLEGKSIWKVKFYHGSHARNLLQQETTASSNSSSDELFTIAMRHANGNARVDDFNSMYAFARVLLTTVIVAGLFFVMRNYTDWRYYFIFVLALVIVWLRCKQRAYYYAREVLNVYLKSKA